MRLPTVLTAVSIVLASLVSASCARQSPPDPRLQSPLVSVAVVEKEPVRHRAFTGVVTARVQSDLGFRVAGKVTHRLVDIGQTVKAGQPLMRLDATDLRLAVLAQTGVVEAARARSVQASADEARLRGLAEQGAVALMEYDRVKAAADSAQAQLAAAEAQARAISNSNGYAVLVADVDAVVVDTLAEPGQVVMAGQTVVRLASAGQREAAINLPEAVRPALGSAATARLYGADCDISWPAHLRQLSDAADQQTRTFEARYVLEGDAGRAPLGSTVTIELATHDGGDRTVVPLGALHDGGKGPGVWVLDANGSAVAFRPVNLYRLSDEQAILSGVRAGERVVALGAHLLHEGEAVRVATLEAAPTSQVAAR